MHRAVIVMKDLIISLGEQRGAYFFYRQPLAFRMNDAMAIGAKQS
jgi:hypothetical protein